MVNSRAPAQAWELGRPGLRMGRVQSTPSRVRLGWHWQSVLCGRLRGSMVSHGGPGAPVAAAARSLGPANTEGQARPGQIC
jgi:hypothetical protein